MESLDAVTVLCIAAKLEKMLTNPEDAERIVGVPSSPFAYQADDLSFTDARNTSQENTLAEFSELMNRIPTAPVWKSNAGVHLWDIYGEILGAQLAQGNLVPQQLADYDAAKDYLFARPPDGATAVEPTAVLQDYRAARQAWLQTSIEYRQAQQAAEASPDPAVRDSWQQVDEPRLRVARDEAWTAWTTGGYKDQVEQALGTITELGAKMPGVVWRRHRDTFNPNLPGQFNTSPNGIRFAPTFYVPGDALDSAWPRVEVTRESLTALASEVSPEVREALDGAIPEQLESVGFDYSVVSITRPWLDPGMELFGSRAWKLPEGAPPLSDGANPPRGRCPMYVETVAFVRNIETTYSNTNADGSILSRGDTYIPKDTVFDLDKGFHAGGTPDFTWRIEETANDTEFLFFEPMNGAKMVEVGWKDNYNDNQRAIGYYPTDGGDPSFDYIDPKGLHNVCYTDDHIGVNVRFGPERFEKMPDGLIFAVLTAEGNLSKVLVDFMDVLLFDFKTPIRIWWVTYNGSGAAPVSSNRTDPEDIYIGAFICREIPRCPDPDPTLSW